MRPPVILLVDDEERFLQTTGKLLERLGYEAQTATSGQAAIDRLERETIHVVILDVKMPGMDGIETLKEIKKRHPLVEVIMLTGHATVSSAVEGMKSGAIDYLMKPSDPEILIEKALAAYEKRQRIEEKIRMAQTRKFVKSPREILRDANPQGMKI